MNCESESASHYAGCDCNEAHWQNEISRLTRERDEARERAAGLSRELLDAMQARDSYRASAELRVGMRREFEEILGVRDTTGEEAFERGLIRLRGLLAAESRAARLEEALALICDTSERNADVCICEMKRIARAALGEVGE